MKATTASTVATRHDVGCTVRTDSGDHGVGRRGRRRGGDAGGGGSVIARHQHQRIVGAMRYQNASK